MNKKIQIALIFICFLGIIVILGTVIIVNVMNQNNKNSNPGTSINPSGKCIIGGCSNQLCLNEGDDTASTCEYTAAYACYQTAKCEKQSTGKCGWTETDVLKLCLSNAK